MPMMVEHNEGGILLIRGCYLIPVMRVSYCHLMPGYLEILHSGPALKLQARVSPHQTQHTDVIVRTLLINRLFLLLPDNLSLILT